MKELVADSAGGVNLSIRVAEPTSVGATLIVVNGGPGMSHEPMRVLERLVDAGVRVVTYDQRGIGASTPPREPSGYALTDYAADLETVRRAIDVERVHVLGHSWGSLVALQYASDHADRVASLIAVAAMPLHWDGLANAQAALGERIGKLQGQGLVSSDLPQTLESDCGQGKALLPAYGADPQHPPDGLFEGATCSGAVGRATMNLLRGYDLRPALEGVDVPTLVVQGDADPFGMDGATMLESAMPRVQLRTMHGCGHAPMFECSTLWGFGISSGCGERMEGDAQPCGVLLKAV